MSRGESPKACRGFPCEASQLPGYGPEGLSMRFLIIPLALMIYVGTAIPSYSQAPPQAGSQDGEVDPVLLAQLNQATSAAPEPGTPSAPLPRQKHHMVAIRHRPSMAYVSGTVAAPSPTSERETNPNDQRLTVFLRFIAVKFLIILPILGIMVGSIARLKSRGFWGWWLYGFLIFPIAFIHVLFIGSGKPRCSHCAERIQRTAKVCRYCGRDTNLAMPYSG